MHKINFDRICYLCGEKGANTKDHLPPRCLLPKNQSGVQRLTLPAHKNCNNGYSKDEEYFRDLIGPTTLDYPEGDQIYFDTQRAWQNPPGKRRLRMFLKNARTVQLRSKAGLYLGKAIGVRPDLARVSRVGMKIAQGIIFSDTQNFADPAKIKCIPIFSNEIIEERDRELKVNNPYWSVLSSEYCLHDNFSSSVAVRRGYSPLSTEPFLTCMCSMLIMVYSQSFVVVGEIELKQVPREFKMIAFNDEFWSAVAAESRSDS